MKSCAWHKDDQAVSPRISCEYCGTMISTKRCDSCRRTYMDWDDISFDDVIAGPFVTSSGDLACMRCGVQIEQERQRAEEEDADYYPEPY